MVNCWHCPILQVFPSFQSSASFVHSSPTSKDLLSQPSMDDQLYTSHRVTPRLAWATAITCLSTLQFGFHLAVLNAPQDIFSCKKHIPGPLPSYEDTLWNTYGRAQCIPMKLNNIALLNTLFTVGGLLSSLFAGSHTVSAMFGRKKLQKICALCYLLGSLLLTGANSLPAMYMGRLFGGIGAGASMVVAPILVSEITPFNHRGLMGSLLQFGVAMGILAAQLIAFPWSNDQQWRYLFLFGAFVALFQFLLLFTTVESPKWLILHRGDVSSATEILHTLRSDILAMRYEINHWRRLSNNTSTIPADKLLSERSSLLESGPQDDFHPLSTSMSRRGSIDPSTLSIVEYLVSPRYRKEWIAIIVIMTAQQLCGMNAITFYGVSVLSNIVPLDTNVLYLTCLLALCNVILALTISPFIDRWGRKPLLLASVTMMGTCSVFISLGLLHNRDYMAAIACFGFIVGFSIGLALIPFLMVSEFASHETIGIAQSFGTMWNWIANIIIAYLFPLLKDIVGNSIFFVFFGISVFYFVAIWARVPETKGKLDYRDIWDAFYY